MFTIGITGGTGAGKTTALHTLKSLGALALDCDAIYHNLLANNTALKSEIDIRFKGVCLNGVIDRERLGNAVFDDHSALIELNAITHKYVEEEVKRQLDEWETHGGILSAIDAVALIESGINKICDVTVAIIAPAETRIKRITERDGIVRQKAIMRVNAQKPEQFYIDNCDYTLEGTCDTKEEFAATCHNLFVNLIRDFMQKNHRFI